MQLCECGNGGSFEVDAIGIFLKAAFDSQNQKKNQKNQSITSLCEQRVGPESKSGSSHSWMLMTLGLHTER